MHANIKALILSTSLAALSSPVVSNAETNMLFILDGSNSMWGQIDGVAKIKTAQDVLSNLLADLPKDNKVGLMVYGHRDKASCKDIELVSAIGADTPTALSSKIKGLQPKGKTPISGALNASIAAFSKAEGENNHVVLISDGLETCDGDPCAAAANLHAANVKARVHVIGFDVAKEEQIQLECIPKAGKGKYFSAGNAGELKAAVEEVKAVAVKTVVEPPPAKKEYEEIFRDDFDGSELQNHWEVANPNPDAFIVENGGLLTLAENDSAALATGKSPNIFRLTVPFPQDDWILSASFNIDFQTEKEAPYLAVYDNEKNYLLVQPIAVHCGNWGDRLCFGVESIKMANGIVTRFDKWLIWEKGFNPFVFDEAASSIQQPIELRILKEGRKYRPGIRWESIDPKTKKSEEKWVELENFTVLRLKGKPAVGMHQKAKVSGESAATIDWVKIEVEKK